jgi:hypothetical protein
MFFECYLIKESPVRRQLSNGRRFTKDMHVIQEVLLLRLNMEPENQEAHSDAILRKELRTVWMQSSQIQGN